MFTTPPPPGTRIAYGAAPSQFLDVRAPDGGGAHPTAVVLHGGFWRAAYDLSHVGHFCAHLARRGWVTVSVEYRRLGEPGGGWPGTLEDVSRALDYLPALASLHGLDLERLVLIGHSAGGHLALWSASRPRPGTLRPLRRSTRVQPRAVVGLAAVSDLERADALGLSSGVTAELLGGPLAAVPERYADASPAALLPLGIRQVLVHGTADEDVPFALSREYEARARALGDPAELVVLDGADHFAPIDPRGRAAATVLGILQRLV